MGAVLELEPLGIRRENDRLVSFKIGGHEAVIGERFGQEC